MFNEATDITEKKSIWKNIVDDDAIATLRKVKGDAAVLKNNITEKRSVDEKSALKNFCIDENLKVGLNVIEKDMITLNRIEKLIWNKTRKFFFTISSGENDLLIFKMLFVFLTNFHFW